MRRRWQGVLIVKGILHSDDARLAREHGGDGVIVSNHGGRQLDHAIASLRVLPEVVAAAGRMPVMIDGGIGAWYPTSSRRWRSARSRVRRPAIQLRGFRSAGQAGVTHGNPSAARRDRP